MPRIPMLSGPQVRTRPVGTPYSRTNPESAFTGLAQGLANLGEAAERVERIEHQLALQEYRRATAVEATDHETKFQRRLTLRFEGDATGELAREMGAAAGGASTGTPPWADPETPAGITGFLQLRGRAAAEKSAELLAALERDREEIARSIRNEDARELFLMRTSGLVEDARRRAERHVAQQIREAEVASLKARSEAALTAIANNFRDPEAVARQVAALEGPIRALALSQEDADAQVAEWHREVAKVRLNQYLSTRDWRGAQELFAQVRDSLGQEATRYEKDISALRRSSEAERLAASAVEMARGPNGRVDVEWAVDMVDSLVSADDVELRDEVRQRVEHRVNLAEREWRLEVSNRFDRAFSAYLKSGHLSAIDPRDKAWLIENAPEEWDRLRMKARQDAAYYRARQNEQQRGETPEQRLAFVEFKADIAANPDRYAEMTPAEFATMWGPKLSPGDFEGAGTLFAATKKEQKLSSGEFGAFVRDNIRKTEMLSKDRRRADLYAARMGDLRRSFLEKNKRYPTIPEMEEMHAEATRMVTIERPWWFDTEKPAFEVPVDELPGAPAAGAAPQTSASPPPAARPSARDRARALQQQGLTPAEIARVLNEEGY